MTTAQANAAASPLAKPPARTKYLVLVGAIVVQLILGTVYGYSIFWSPLNVAVFPQVITQANADTLEAAGTAVTAAEYTVVADVAEVKAQIGRQKGYLKHAFAICILSFALTMVIAGRVQDIKGPRFPAIVGAVLLGGGFVLASMMNSPMVLYIAHAAFMGAVAIVLLMLFHALLGKVDENEVPLVKYVPLGIVTAVVVAGVVLGNQYVGQLGQQDQLMLLWGTIGLLAGAGIGFAYVCPIAALVKWFPEHKGLVSGLAVAGFGFGAYIFTHKNMPLSAESFIKKDGNTITDLFMMHGLVSLITVSMGAMLLRNPPAAAPAAGVVATNDSHWQDTLKRPAFYIIWLMFFSGAMAGLMVIGILKGFAGDQLVDAAKSADATGWITTALAQAKESLGDAYDKWFAGATQYEVDAAQFDAVAAKKWISDKGVAAVGWLAIFNAVGRVVWGFVSDRIGRTFAFVAMFVFQAVMMSILVGMKSELSLAVAASLVGFNFGGNFALFPSATADLFGAKNVGANYGWVFTSYGIAGVVGIAAGNYAYNEFGSYGVAFTVAAVLCVVSAVLAIGLAVARKKQTA